MNEINGSLVLQLNPLKNPDGNYKVAEFQVSVPLPDGSYKALNWIPISGKFEIPEDSGIDKVSVAEGKRPVQVQFRSGEGVAPAL